MDEMVSYIFRSMRSLSSLIYSTVSITIIKKAMQQTNGSMYCAAENILGFSSIPMAQASIPAKQQTDSSKTALNM